MTYAKQLLDSYPRTFNVDARMLAETIDALNDCAQACTADADDDLSEPANITRPLLEACVAACKSRGDECERHAMMHEHCRVCAEACRRCEQSCRRLIAAIA